MAQAMYLTSIPFDTLQYAKKLQEVGFTEKQAEVQVEIIKEQTTVLNDSINNHLATKADIKLIENNIKLLETEIKRLEERLNERINHTNEKIALIEKNLTERIIASETRLTAMIISLEERTKRRITTMGYKTIVALGSLMIAGVTILAYLK